MIKKSKSRIVFLIVNYIILIFYAVICILPLLNLGAISLSKSTYAEAGLVGLIPKGLNVSAYEYIIKGGEYFHAFGISILRLLLGVPLSLIMTFLMAYPLARPVDKFSGRSFYVVLVMICMLFSGGLVPEYMLKTSLNLNNTLWALVLPGVGVFNVIVLMNFFRSVPLDLHEAAELDGASEWFIMLVIYVPLSLPAVMTLALFSLIGHWNSWLDGVMYMSTVDKMPLQSYLQSVVVNMMDNDLMEIVGTNYVSQDTMDAARLFLSIIPILLMYFPLQKYFVKGLTLGGVKG